MANIENLKLIAAHMRKIAADLSRERGFNLSCWASDSHGAAVDSDRPGCGSAACAIGFCALDGVIPSLQMGKYEGGVTPIYGDILCGWAAVRELTGLNMVESEYLFDPGHYLPEERADPLKVAERIEQWLEDYAARSA